MLPLLDLIFTPRCVFCQRIIGVGHEDKICPRCHPETYREKPPFCPLCGRHTEEEGMLCESCRRRKPPIIGRGAFRYDGIIRDSLHRFKFENRRDYSRLLGKLLHQAEAQWLNDFGPDVLTFVPLHKKRQRERGYNQAEELAKVVSACSGIPCEPLLVRTRSTMPQMSLNALLRAQNIEGAFVVDPRRKQEPLPRKIVIVDDIFTTGSTLGECASAIKKVRPDAEIRFLTVAVTPPPRQEIAPDGTVSEGLPRPQEPQNENFPCEDSQKRL